MASILAVAELLQHAIQRSAVAAHVPASRARQILSEHIVPNVGRVDLDRVWTALLAEPGVHDRMLAPSFVLIEAYAEPLALPVTPTTALGALSPDSRQMLLEECPLPLDEAAALCAAAAPAPTAPAQAAPTAPAQAAPTAPAQAAPAAAASAESAPAAAASAGSLPAPAEDVAVKAERARAARALIQQMGGTSPALTPLAERPRPAPVAPRPVPRQATAPRVSRRLILGATAAGLFCLAAGLGLWLSTAPDDDRYDLSFVTELRLVDGRRSHRQVRAVLKDDRWAGLGPTERRQAVESAWGLIRDRGIDSLSIVDGQGEPVAVAGKELPMGQVLLLRNLAPTP